MSVSHTLVSLIQVIGLIVGLYGFFFLSVSTLGDTSARWFAALLPALASGLSALIFLSEYPVHLSEYFGLSKSALPTLPSWGGWLAPLLAFVVAYWLGIPRKEAIRKPSKFVVVTIRVVQISMTVITALLFLETVLLLIVRFVQGKVLTQQESFEVIITIAAILYVAALMSGYWLPRILIRGRLLMLGFILSLLAILTQFIPPVLDLLGISIR